MAKGAFTLEPLDDRIVVKPAEEEETTVSGIVIPDTAKEKPQEGEVVAVGPGRFEEGSRVPMDVKVGDRVLYSKYGGTEVKVQGEEYLVLSARDGVTIAKEVELEDPYENMGAQLTKEVATKTNDVAGDGTTTATVLARAMVKAGMRNVAAGANPMALKRGIERAVSAASKEIGEVIAEALDKVGKDGVVTVEESQTFGMELDFVEGMQFDKGYISPYFVTDQERMESVLDEPYILLVNKKISSVQELLPLLEKVLQAGKPLLIEAEDVTVDLLGRARKVVVTKDDTTIVEGEGSEEDIKGRINQIKAEIEKTDSDWDKEKLQERLAKLSGGVALIKVGAATEVELKEKKHRIEDALSATRAAVEEGIVPGGGVALVRSEEAIDPASLGLDGDEATGALIVRRALAEPTRLIAGNAGYEGSVIVERLRGEKGSTGFDAARGEWVDMFKGGILDPGKVTRSALQNAASIAALVLTTESAVVEKPEEEEDEAAAGGHVH